MRRGANTIKLPTKRLSRRELEVLTLLATGYRPYQIPRVLSIRLETVKDYIKRACRKLQAADKTHAVALAVALGLVTPFGRGIPKDAAK